MTQRARGTAVTTEAVFVSIQKQRENAGVMVNLQCLGACGGPGKGFCLSQANNSDVFSCVNLFLRAFDPPENQDRKIQGKNM